eukprot:366334-Chlamydomonas_euryale.AAC.11
MSSASTWSRTQHVATPILQHTKQAHPQHRCKPTSPPNLAVRRPPCCPGPCSCQGKSVIKRLRDERDPMRGNTCPAGAMEPTEVRVCVGVPSRSG